MILYHGSNRNFEKFDVKYINTGEGLQKFGYGFYFTDNIELADHYSLKWLYECDVYNTQKFVEWDSTIDNYSNILHRLKFLNKDREAEELEIDVEENGDWTYQQLYEWLEHILGDKKYVSNFFEFIDIEGIIANDPLNRGKVYVVFDVRNIKIVDSWLRDEGRQQYETKSNNYLAPNGKKSNLNSILYDLVRTVEFKKWFGDWENDPKNSSKVIDENGEPLICYHGTNKVFDTFKKMRPNFYAITEGSYFFVDNKEIAKNFGKNIIYVFLNIDNPTILDGRWSGRFNTWVLEDDFGNYGFIVHNSDTGGGFGTEYVVENIKQIKMIDKEFININESTELKTAVIKITKTFNMDLKYYIQAVPFHTTQSDKIYIKKRNGTFGSISTKNIEVLKTFNHADEKGINDYIEREREEFNKPIKESISDDILTLYHGSKNFFNKFSLDFIKIRGLKFGYGIYFSKKSSIAKTFNNKYIYKCNIIKNNFLNWNDLSVSEQDIFNNYMNNIGLSLTKYDTTFSHIFSKLLNYYNNTNDDIYSDTSLKSIYTDLVRLGFDGIYSYDEYCIFKPENVIIDEVISNIKENIESTILTLYHGTDDKHQFDTHGYLVNGTFFSDQKKTAAKYGKYIYEVKFKDLNLMDLIYDKKHISELLKHFPVLEEEDYNLKVTTVEQFYELSDSWGIIESNKDVLEWIKGNYDGVKLLEGGMEHNILVFKPFKDKIVSSELVEDLNESITAYHGSTNNFKNFDFNYIKTMYYGWGLYFTDNKNIADGYGKEHGHTIEINGVDYQNDFISINKLGTTYDVKTLITDIKECIKSYERDIIRYPDNSSNTQLINLISQAKYILELLENSNGNYKVKNKNIVYQVDIFKNNPTLLKWNDDIDEKTLSLINIKIPKKYQTTGEIIYEYLCNRHFNRNKKETSLYLKSIGIDGIIVNHRDDNIYVVFDKDDINEVERLDESIKLKTQTKKWFGDSVITDDNGEPLVLYHGTSNVFNKFDIKRTTQGIIWFSTDKDKIEKGESGAAGSKIILECIIKANKVAGWEEYEKLMLGQIEELGYDAVKLDDDYFVFSDKQIKIIDWKFNSKNLKITYHGKLPSSDYKWLEIVGRRSYSGGELTPIIANDILVGGISWNLGGIDMIIFKQEFRNKGLLKHIVYDNVENGVVKFVTASEELISKLKNYGEVTYDSDTDITSVHINKKMNESNYGNDVLDLPFVEGVPSEEKVKEIQKWLTKNTDKYNIKYVKLYHATNPNIDVLNQGLKPTSYTRRRSYQSTSGYVYLAATPERAKVFGDIGNGCDSTVYEVIIPIWKLKPDMDQLNNQKSVGKNVKNTVAYSLIYGGGVRYKGAIEPWQIRKVDNNISENYNTELENWFTGSKVVNEDGTPKVVYHGTAAEEDFTEFMGDRGIGWFTPNKEYAENYTRESGKLISIYLSIKNPYVLNVSPQVEMTIEDFIKETGIDIKKKYYGDEYKGEVRNVWDWYNPSLTNFFEKLEELGYDGIKTLEYDKYESWCPFDNSQIKKIEDNISTKISEHYKPTSNILINQNFKKWFNGSKVINENGTPKIVYHGMQSNEKFYVFDKKRQINGNHGKGFYFGDINYATSYYGDNYIACYLKITKLFDMYAEYDITEIKRIYGDYYNLVEDFIKKESEISYNGKIQGFVFYNYIGNINTLLISAGYDGIKHDFVYVVFEPNQIKLADGTNRTFNGNSDDIREAYVNSDGEYIDDGNTLIGQRYDAPYGFKCMNCDEETYNMLIDKWYSGDEYEYLADEGDWKLYTYKTEILSSDKKDLYWHTDNILKINSKDHIICTKEGDKIWDIKIRKSNLTAEQEMQIRFYEKDSKYYADRFIKLDYTKEGNPLIYLKTMDTKGVYKIEIYPDGTFKHIEE